MSFKKDVELIKELEPELERFQKKFLEYKTRIAKVERDYDFEKE
jgi:hypothetical protein